MLVSIGDLVLGLMRLGVNEIRIFRFFDFMILIMGFCLLHLADMGCDKQV